jgi:hypothetical protein
MKMARQKLTVRLTQDERDYLEGLLNKGKHNSQVIKRASILLLCDVDRPAGKLTTSAVIEALSNVTTTKISAATIYAVKKCYTESGVQATLIRKKRETPPIAPKITGDIEARIIALSCSKPPEGAARWSLRMLRDKVIELEILDEVSHVTLHELLKKTKSNRTE